MGEAERSARVQIDGVSSVNDNEIHRFRSALNRDPELAAAVFARGTDLAGVATLANELGYAFSADALDETLRARTRKMFDDRELALRGGSWVRMGAPGAITTVLDGAVVANVYTLDPVAFVTV